MNLKFLRAPAAFALVLASCSAFAIPNLQLGIQGASYDTATQTSVAQPPTGSGSFNLLAFLNIGNSATPASDNYYISAALVRTDGTRVSEIPGGLSLGSFKFAGLNYQVTSGMVFGTPPLETALALQGDSLPSHGIFPTYFKQFSVPNFTGAATYADLDVQSNASLSSLTSGGMNNGSMYGKSFAVDVSGLQQGYAIHFDLYNEACADNNTATSCTLLDIKSFAPFSHDAQSGGGLCVPGSSGCNAPPVPGVPEPGSLALICLALLGLGGLRQAKRAKPMQFAAA